ncbi:GGDEF domain-containing protein [Marinobacter sp. CHS3-4]|uniref:GGDEF domain-containing protein n=1 Tax=Marinobacter sp. CHS3-4 TaxID=3045174 RepID=UPI0024B6148E|nr:GGDEF domain-containing protein [Marinobacter sp. CHS3-4]MDI9246304.1 diguanylate cyclase [Marinobacter sp. CHS3-4]
MDSRSESLRALARPYRKAVLQAVLVLTIVAGALFATLNLARDHWPLAVAEIVMVIFAGSLLFVIRTTDKIEYWAWIFLILFCVTMFFSMMLPTSTTSVFGWVLIIPILSHLLLGRHQGLLLSGIVMFLVGILYWVKHQDQPAMLEALPIANTSLIAICVLAFSHVYELTRERSELRLFELAQTDPLTGLANRARLQETFERERKRALREESPLSILVIDLDHFKAVNDEFGHEAGDLVLQQITDRLKKSLRASDLPVRMGGEEFSVLLTNTTSAQAVDVAEKVRGDIASMAIRFEGKTLNITSSGGIAELGSDGENLRSMLRAADKRLYLAKANGRNQVLHQTDEPSLSTAL